jgi:hypothetical protein
MLFQIFRAKEGPVWLQLSLNEFKLNLNSFGSVDQFEWD